MAELIVQNISKSFGEVRVLADVSLTVPHGGFTIILGPSGCGKSTLLRIIAGLETADTGRIVIGGKDVTRLSPKDRDLAMVFQSYALYPHLNVRQNLAFGLKMRHTPKQEIQERVAAAAGMLELDNLLERMPSELSGGQRQRVAIGRAIVRDPKLFLFDEPLSNLDAQLRAGMRVELARLHQRLSATMVYVTHDQVEAMTLGQVIMVLDQGKVQQTGSPEDVYKRPVNIFVAGFVGSSAMNLLPGRVETAGDECWLDRGLGQDRLALPSSAASLAGQRVTLGVRPEDLLPGEGPFLGVVELVEPVGGESILHLDSKGAPLRARLTSEVMPERGQAMRFSARAGALHFFGEDGRRLGP